MPKTSQDSPSSRETKKILDRAYATSAKRFGKDSVMWRPSGDGVIIRPSGPYDKGPTVIYELTDRGHRDTWKFDTQVMLPPLSGHPGPVCAALAKYKRIAKLSSDLEAMSKKTWPLASFLPTKSKASSKKKKSSKKSSSTSRKLEEQKEKIRSMRRR